MSASILNRELGGPPEQPADDPSVNVFNGRHKDAVRLYNEVVQKDCTNILNLIWRCDKICATVYAQRASKTVIVSAAWGRMYNATREDDTGQLAKGVFVGPIVSLDGAYARAAVARVIHQASIRYCEDRGGAVESTLLGTNVTASHNSADIFGQLGFDELARAKFMVLQDEMHSTSSTEDHDNLPKLDIMSANLNQYFGVVSYEIG